MSLTEFLLDRFDDDERAARKLAEVDRRPVLSLAMTVNHPERLLLEIEAKRRIVGFAQHAQNLRDEFADPVRSESGYAFGQWSGCRVILGHLADLYADHPDFDESWRS